MARKTRKLIHRASGKNMLRIYAEEHNKTERQALIDVIRRTRSNQESADLIGVHRTTFQRYLNDHDIRIDRTG